MSSSDSVSAEEFRPATASELCRFLKANVEGPRRPVVPVGGRTSLHFGFERPRLATQVSLTDLSRVVDYPARDMTITVEAGLRVSVLTEQLQRENQRLPVDIAQSYRATIGGAIATNTSGPRRFGHGTLRDCVIGVAAADAGGRLFRAGGRVVKNVAGYDLCKLLVGSLGTLAVLTEVTLRLRPLPETETLVWCCFDSMENLGGLLDRLNTSETRPIAIELLDARAARHVAAESRQTLPSSGPVLCVGYEGVREECRWQVQQLQRELAVGRPRQIVILEPPETTALWEALTEYPTFSDDPLSFQASLLPSATAEFVRKAAAFGVSVQAHAGNGVLVGHLPEETITLEDVQRILMPLQQFARSHAGSLIILQCQERWKPHLPVFGPPQPAWCLMRKLKQTFDPHNLLNPGVFIDRPMTDEGVSVSAGQPPETTTA